MIDEETRRRYVKCFRSLSTEDAAMQLASAFERELIDRLDDELTQLEQLADWEHGSLLEWALSHPVPTAIADASSILIMREFRLIGDLARAAEQAMAKGEVQHSQHIARALAQTWQRIRGEQILSEVLTDDEAEA